MSIVYTENVPEGEMMLDMTVQDLSRAVEYYLNNIVFKKPVHVVGVEKLSAQALHGGNTFQIKFESQQEGNQVQVGAKG